MQTLIIQMFLSTHKHTHTHCPVKLFNLCLDC